MQPSSLWKTASDNLPRLLLALTFGLFLFYFLRPEYGIDIFWHVKAGEVILEAQSFPTTDIFNYQHPEREWVTFEWLYEVAAHGLYEWGGFTALRVANVLLLLLGFALTWRFARLALEKRWWLAWFVLAVFSVLYHDRIRIRPHVLNLVFLMALMPAILGRFKDASRASYAWLIGVAVLWANVHAGGVNVLVLVLGALFLGGLADWRRFGETALPLKALFIAGLVMALGLVLSPNYLQGNITALTMFEATKLIIPEWNTSISYLDHGSAPHFVLCGLFPYGMMVVIAWQGSTRLLGQSLRGGLVNLGVIVVLATLAVLAQASLTGATIAAGAHWAFILILVASLLLLGTRQREPGLFGELLMALVLLFLSHSSARFVYLAIVPMVLWIKWNLPLILSRERLSRATALVLGLCFLGTGIHYFFYVQRSGVAHAVEMMAYELEPTRFPILACDFFEDAGLEGRLFNQTEWGGYLLFRHFPESKVFSDGRGNLDNDELIAAIETHKSKARARSFDITFDHFPYDYVVFRAPLFPKGSWDHRKWLRVYHDPDADIFLRLHEGTRTQLTAVLAYYRAKGIVPKSTAQEDMRTFERDIARYHWGAWSQEPFNRGRLSRYQERATAPLDAPRDRQRGALLLARAYIKGDLLAEASAAVNNVLREHPFHARALFLGAWVRYLQGRPEEAMGPLQTARMLDDMSLYHVLGKGSRLRPKDRAKARELQRWILSDLQ